MYSKKFGSFAGALVLFVSGICAATGAQSPSVSSPQVKTVQVGTVINDANVIAVAVRKAERFLLTRKDNATYTVLVLPEGRAPDDAVVLVPPLGGRIIESIHPAKDALYVLTHEGAEAVLLRIPVRSVGGTEMGFAKKNTVPCRNCRLFPMLRRNVVTKIPLPSDGTVLTATANPLVPGISLTLKARTGERIVQTYDPSRGRFVARPAASAM